MSRCGANERPRAYLTFHLTFMHSHARAAGTVGHALPHAGLRDETRDGRGGEDGERSSGFGLPRASGYCWVWETRALLRYDVRRLYNSIHVHFRFCLCLPCPNIYGTV